MEDDFLQYLDVELARALRCLDRACMIARDLQEHREAIPRAERKRTLEAARRALSVRRAIEAAGIQLPPLRRIQDRYREEESSAVEELTVSQIADMAGVHRATIIRYIRAAGGPIAEKYAKALRARQTAHFSLEEAAVITEAGAAPLELPQIANGGIAHR